MSEVSKEKKLRWLALKRTAVYMDSTYQSTGTLSDLAKVELETIDAIRRLIEKVGEWQEKAKKHLEKLDDEPLAMDVLDALDLLGEIRDFGKEAAHE